MTTHPAAPIAAVRPVPDAPSLRLRAFLAVALTVAFYLLAVGIAAALIVLPIALWVLGGHGNLWITVAMVGAGVTIIQAIIPERDRFEPVGPELTRAMHPRLHRLLDEVAQELGEAPPDAVYVYLPVNASVGEQRGKRYLNLGLPLMATLSHDELKAVIAHEYGHYMGGDTRFSKWIWRTRVAVLKTVRELATSESWFRRSIVRWPFDGYARLFLRITNALSRRAEFAADAVAARAASADAAGRALRRLEAVSPAFDRFWASDVVPMLEKERRPAIAAGFTAMAAHVELAGELDEIVRSDLKSSEPDPYASHPTLRQRLEALGVEVEAQAPAPAQRPATDLLDDLPALEQRVLADTFGDHVAAFDTIDWREAVDVHLVGIRETVDRFGTVIPVGATVAGAGSGAASLCKRRGKLRELLPEADRDAPVDALDGLLVNVLAGLVVLAARREGWTVSAMPGEPTRIHARGGGAVLDPWEILGPITAGETLPYTWTQHPVVQELWNTRLAA